MAKHLPFELEQPVMEAINQFSGEESGQMFQLCYSANYVAGLLLDGIHGESGDTEFPVDIRKIVELCGIRVYETNLNIDIGFQMERNNGYLKHWSADEWRIYLDSRDSEQEKRYVLAHELSHFLIEQKTGEDKNAGYGNEMHCMDPFFPKFKEELFADILASFLLFPPGTVLKYFDQYAGELEEQNRYPLNAFEWIRVLAQKAQVSPYATIICYQYLKYYMCYVYQQKQDNDGEWGSGAGRMAGEYEKFFK